MTRAPACHFQQMPPLPECPPRWGVALRDTRGAAVQPMMMPRAFSLSMCTFYIACAIKTVTAITVVVTAVCNHCTSKSLRGFVMLLVFLQPQTGDRWCLPCPRTEGDGSSKPKAWEVACGFAQKSALLCVLWCVSSGCSGGVGDDGGPQLPPPKPRVPPLFVGACIYANVVPRKQHRSVDIVGGKGPQDNVQVCLVVPHPITF